MGEIYDRHKSQVTAAITNAMASTDSPTEKVEILNAYLDAAQGLAGTELPGPDEAQADAAQDNSVVPLRKRPKKSTEPAPVEVEPEA